jgi:hypothetical protein
MSFPAITAGDLVHYNNGGNDHVFYFISADGKADPTAPTAEVMKNAVSVVRTAVEHIAKTNTTLANVISAPVAPGTYMKYVISNGVMTHQPKETLKVTPARLTIIKDLIGLAASLRVLQPLSPQRLPPLPPLYLNPHISIDNSEISGEISGGTYSVRRGKLGVTIKVSWPPYTLTITIPVVTLGIPFFFFLKSP